MIVYSKKQVFASHKLDFCRNRRKRSDVSLVLHPHLVSWWGRWDVRDVLEYLSYACLCVLVREKDDY